MKNLFKINHLFREIQLKWNFKTYFEIRKKVNFFVKKEILSKFEKESMPFNTKNLLSSLISSIHRIFHPLVFIPSLLDRFLSLILILVSNFGSKIENSLLELSPLLLQESIDILSDLINTTKIEDLVIEKLLILLEVS